MIRDVILKIKTRRDALLYERTFLAKREKGETAQEAAVRLKGEKLYNLAEAYELIDHKFPGLFEKEIGTK